MKSRVAWYFIFLAIGMVVTFMFLAILAFILYKFRLDGQVVRIIVFGIHIIIPFLIGIMCGKKMKQRKYLWGLLAGLGYFAIVLVISLILGMDGEDASQIWKILAITVAAGTAGGMLG